MGRGSKERWQSVVMKRKWGRSRCFTAQAADISLLSGCDMREKLAPYREAAAHRQTDGQTHADRQKTERESTLLGKLFDIHVEDVINRKQRDPPHCPAATRQGHTKHPQYKHM